MDEIAEKIASIDFYCFATDESFAGTLTRWLPWDRASCTRL